MDIWALLSVGTKFILYVSTFYAVGTVLYQAIFETRETKTVFKTAPHITIATSVGLLAVIASYGVRAGALTGEFSGIIDPQMLGVLWQTPVGTVLVLRLLGFGLILAGVFTGRAELFVSLIGSLMILVSFAQIGHVTNVQNWYSPVLLLVHLIGISLWIGIFLPLYQMTKFQEISKTTAQIAHKFGQISMFFVPVLVLVGGVLAIFFLSSIEMLFVSSYGRLLLFKLAIVAALLSLAAVNKLRLVPKLKLGKREANAQLRKSILFEICLVLGALFTTAILTSSVTLPDAHM